MQREHENHEMDQLLSCQEAADRLGISLQTLYVYKSIGKLKAIEREGMRPVFLSSYIDHIKKHGYER